MPLATYLSPKPNLLGPGPTGFLRSGGREGGKKEQNNSKLATKLVDFPGEGFRTTQLLISQNVLFMVSIINDLK
jgi:hypothetical protein